MSQTPPQPLESQHDPHRLARLFLKRNYHRDGLTIRYWNGRFLRWDQGAYAPVLDADLRAELTGLIREVFEDDAHRERSDSSGKRSEPTVRQVTRPLVSNVEQALSGLCLLPAGTAVPAWIDGADGPPAERQIVAPNGIRTRTQIPSPDRHRACSPSTVCPSTSTYAHHLRNGGFRS